MGTRTCYAERVILESRATCLALKGQSLVEATASSEIRKRLSPWFSSEVYPPRIVLRQQTTFWRHFPPTTTLDSLRHCGTLHSSSSIFSTNPVKQSTRSTSLEAGSSLWSPS